MAGEILINFFSIVINMGLVGGMTLAADSAHTGAAAAAPAAAPSPTSSLGTTPTMSAFLHCGITSYTYLIPPAIQKQEFVRFIRGPYEKFVDWRQCAAVMQEEAVIVMPSCSDGSNVVVA
jgi:hypothetical protein